MCTLGWEVGRSVHTEIDPTSPIMGVKTKWNPDLEASGIKRYTGSGLKKTDPERYESVVKAARRVSDPKP